MDDDHKVFTGVALALCLLLAFLGQKCSEYGAKDLEARRACVTAGHTPMECGLVRVVQ